MMAAPPNTFPVGRVDNVNSGRNMYCDIVTVNRLADVPTITTRLSFFLRITATINPAAAVEIARSAMVNPNANENLASCVSVLVFVNKSVRGYERVERSAPHPHIEACDSQKEPDFVSVSLEMFATADKNAIVRPTNAATSHSLLLAGTGTFNKINPILTQARELQA
jgi:hypothetical protein